jgi:hypothetical protein
VYRREFNGLELKTLQLEVQIDPGATKTEETFGRC